MQNLRWQTTSPWYILNLTVSCFFLDDLTSICPLAPSRRVRFASSSPIRDGRRTSLRSRPPKNLLRPKISRWLQGPHVRHVTRLPPRPNVDSRLLKCPLPFHSHGVPFGTVYHLWDLDLRPDSRRPHRHCCRHYFRRLRAERGVHQHGRWQLWAEPYGSWRWRLQCLGFAAHSFDAPSLPQCLRRCQRSPSLRSRFTPR